MFEYRSQRLAVGHLEPGEARGSRRRALRRDQPAPRTLARTWQRAPRCAFASTTSASGSPAPRAEHKPPTPRWSPAPRMAGGSMASA